MKKRIAGTCLSAVLMISFIGGCSQGAEQKTADQSASVSTQQSSQNEPAVEGNKTEIKYVGFCDESSAMGEAFYPLFNKWQNENQDVQVSLEYVGGDDLKAKIKADASAGMLADVFYFWGTLSNNAYLLKAGLVATTEEVVEKVEPLKMENLPDSTKKIISYQGVPYGLPMDATHAGFYVNKKIYEECGVALPDTYDVFTYEQFRKDGEVFREHGYIPLATGWQAGNPGHFYLSEIINQLPGGMDEMLGLLDYGNMSGSGNLATAMRYVVDDIKLGMYQEGVLNDSWNEMTALYQEEKAAATYTHVNILTINTQNPELIENTLVMPFPRIPESTNEYTSKYYSFAVAYNNFVKKESWNDSAKQGAIARFLDFLYGEEVMTMYSQFAEPAWSFDYEIPTSNLSPIVQKSLVFAKGKQAAPFFLAVVPDSSAWQDFKNVLMECASEMITPEECEKQVGEVFSGMSPDA